MADKREVINASDEAASSTPARSSSELFCDSCIQDGYELLAEGYCLDCGHHLCDGCFKIHRKPQPLRHHQLLPKDVMPMTKPKKVPLDECKEKCRVHKDEIMKYFCEDHGEVGCNVCVTLSHRTCNVGYIPTLAEDLFNNDEYKSFRRSLKSMSNRVSDCTDFATRYVRRIINDTDRNISAIIKRRKEVNDFFDKLEREVKGELQQNLSKNLTKITHLLSSCNKLDVWFQEEQEDLNNKEDNGQKCCLFVDMKLMKKEILHEYQKALIDIENDNMSYIPSNETVHMACDTSAMLGVFVRRDSVVNVSQSETDISDITLLTNDKLVAVNDKANCALIVNAEQSQVTQSQSFPFPARVTRVSDSWFAAWYNNKIGEYYWTDRKILLLKTIHCPGLRWPIAFMDNTYIGFTELTGSYGYAVRIIDVRGNEMKTFPSGENKKRNTFVDPHYIVVNQDNTLLYVTDNGGRIVKCLTMDGDLRAEFRPQHDWDPEGIAMSCDGTVYVCDYMNSNIHILTFDLREVGVINGVMFGIKQPLGIVYCEANQKLYVGMENSTNMVVLKVETPDKFLEDNNK